MILMIYNKKLCREILLPNLHNSDYELILSKKEYGMKQDLKILLEVTGEGWKMDSTEDYRIQLNGEVRQQCRLNETEIPDICTLSGEVLKIIAVDVPLSMQISGKYDLTYMNQVSVGKADGNLIQYDFRELVSSYHAELIRHSDGWYLVDKSSNGVFHKNGRVNGTYKLQFGEHLNIFGLHLVILGDILAVGTNYGKLKVNEEILRKKNLKSMKFQGRKRVRKGNRSILTGRRGICRQSIQKRLK